MAIVHAHLDYIDGYIRYAHYEAEIPDSELVEFKNKSKEEQHEIILDKGDLIIDDTRINDIGEITEIIIVE